MVRASEIYVSIRAKKKADGRAGKQKKDSKRPSAKVLLLDFHERRVQRQETETETERQPSLFPFGVRIISPLCYPLRGADNTHIHIRARITRHRISSEGKEKKKKKLKSLICGNGHRTPFLLLWFFSSSSSSFFFFILSTFPPLTRRHSPCENRPCLKNLATHTYILHRFSKASIPATISLSLSFLLLLPRPFSPATKYHHLAPPFSLSSSLRD